MLQLHVTLALALLLSLTPGLSKHSNNQSSIQFERHVEKSNSLSSLIHPLKAEGQWVKNSYYLTMTADRIEGENLHLEDFLWTLLNYSPCRDFYTKESKEKT